MLLLHDATASATAASPRLAAGFPELREPSERWIWFVYALILGAFMAICYFQLNGVVRHLLHMADRHEGIRPLLYPSLLWTGMGCSC